MSKLVLLWMIMLFGAVFLVIPANNNPPVYALFPLNPKAEIGLQSYVYFIFEHFQLIALCYVIASEAKVYRLSCKTFFWLQVADFADYLLTYNVIWFYAGTLPVSMNVVKIAAFVFVAAWDYHRESLSRRL